MRLGTVADDGDGRSWALPHPTRLDPARPDYAAVLTAHDRAVLAGEPGYVDPTTGLFVFTAVHHLERGDCCDSGCRHCQWVQ